ncbi:DUF4012 domain-containing protein [Nocardioides coralli]|uniref:DUF4012 domain-containing protein n=1 Tax=Nocardioides coralli TaxID=2872154 RepID=UPI001CA3DBE2|nr:DUF4012 domain-containing protein [Nocardioides coralli]QZY28776.1 DUF4012 domain-containing protein [Nocardioides coralli]
MLTPRRLLVLTALLAVLAAGTHTGWLVLQVRSDLLDARSAAERLRQTADEGQQAQRDAADDLRAAAADAAEHTDGLWWSVMTRVPVVGDDAAAVRALSGSLDTLTGRGLDPLATVLDLLPRLSHDGRVAIGVARQLQAPVAQAHGAVALARDEVAGIEASDLSGAVREQFEEYVEMVTDADAALASGLTATRALPTMLGGDEPRRYLLIFQNNAEIRATGGLPGSWATVEADRGRLRMARQGAGGGFAVLPEPVGLSKAERGIYGDVHGTYFVNANFTPDFPRAAELWRERFALDYPEEPLDGVVALDPVALSYLLGGAGPVETRGTTLTPDNIVDELLHRPYLELTPGEQDRLFADTARAVFDAVTGDPESPVDLVQGLSRASAEGRLLVAPFENAEAELLAGSDVLGALPGDDGETPHVHVALNDATGSKMSYFLRYYGDVSAGGCQDGRQSLQGSVTLRQSISPRDARVLPDYVTGGGRYGTTPGSQLVLMRIYAPHGGSIGEIRLNGERVDKFTKIVELDGRPVATVVAALSSTDDVVVRWDMETGPGQTADGVLEMTPSVVPGRNRWGFSSAC